MFYLMTTTMGFVVLNSETFIEIIIKDYESLKIKKNLLYADYSTNISWMLSYF